MNTVLSVKNVTKYYSRIRALNEVSFDVPQGSVFGILGPNGSGKTTLLGIILDVLKATKGDFLWFGKPGSSEQRRKIGSMLETPNFYSYMSARDNLKITQAISGRGEASDIDEVLKKVNLFDRQLSPFKTYSLGMKQRLGIAAALLGNPGVLVLDEPTNGLDPVGIAEIRNLIVELKEKGFTIIMASHLLDEVEKVCTHAAILKTGALITTGAVEEIMSEDDVVEVSALDLSALEAVLQKLGKKIIVDKKAGLIEVIFPKGTARLDEVNRFCFDNGVVLNGLRYKRKKLEARFFELTQN